MQFATTVIFTLALALGVQASILPYAYWPYHTEIAGHGLSYTAVTGPHPNVHAHPAGPVVAVHAPHWAAHVPAAIDVHHAAPAVVVASHAPVVVAHPAPEGTYVAKTRGAIHTAPLAGHANSVASVNVDPAPGTV